MSKRLLDLFQFHVANFFNFLEEKDARATDNNTTDYEFDK